MDKGCYQTSYYADNDRHGDQWKHKCGCFRTSDKLKQILKSFPATPPPSPSNYDFPNATMKTACVSAYCTGVNVNQPHLAELRELPSEEPLKPTLSDDTLKAGDSKTWRVIRELVQLLQLSVTATALALYYLIYCYMQLIYYTLRSALYFHNADGPMKITIGVVTLTSLVVGINLILRMERLIGIFR